MNNISLKPWSLGTEAIDIIQEVEELFEEKDLCFGHGTDNPLDEAMALVFFALGADYPYREKSSSIKVSNQGYSFITKLVNQRIFEKKPLPYLTQEAFFCGHKFYVDERVLIPRSPIAELIRNQFSPWVTANSVQCVLDIATGSGCLAIAIAKSFPDAEVIASDVSKEALEVAKINIDKLSVGEQVTLVESDLFENSKISQDSLKDPSGKNGFTVNDIKKLLPKQKKNSLGIFASKAAKELFEKSGLSEDLLKNPSSKNGFIIFFILD